MQPSVKLIAAVGRSGQLGLDGGLPWGDRFPEDRRRFRELTRDGIVVVGFRTWFSVAKLDGTAGRKFYAPNRHDTPEQVITRLRRYGDDRTIWIAGGAATYRKWLPVVQECHISILDYDGPCDVVMPPLWVPRPVSPDDWRTSHGPAP